MPEVTLDQSTCPKLLKASKKYSNLITSMLITIVTAAG